MLDARTARLADPRHRRSPATAPATAPVQRVAPKITWAGARRPGTVAGRESVVPVVTPIAAPPALSSPPRAARFGLEFDNGSFVVARGPGLIGRDPAPRAGEHTTHLVTLADPTFSVSRTHLEFGVGNGGLWVRDRHSTNGSDIEFNGQRTPLEPGRAVSVRPASTIHLGGRRIRVRTVDSRAVMGAVTVEWGVATSVGKRHERNQDSFGASPPVFIVADGIGSHRGGDVASREAVQALLTLAGRQPVTADMFNGAMADAQARIARIPVQDPSQPPGTTISGVIVTHDDGVPCWMVVNLGDSRTYRLDAAGLRQLTVDHSLFQKLIDSGVVERSASPPLPLKNLLSRALFGEAEHSPDVARLPMKVGDRILVCSDGISSTVEDATMRGVLQTVRDPQTAAEKLLDTATKAGARDDVTAVVVDAVAITPRRAESLRDSPGSPADDRSVRMTRARWRAGDRDNAI
jgi:PPM family protein phosphatase